MMEKVGESESEAEENEGKQRKMARRAAAGKEKVVETAMFGGVGCEEEVKELVHYIGEFQKNICTFEPVKLHCY